MPRKSKYQKPKEKQLSSSTVKISVVNPAATYPFPLAYQLIAPSSGETTVRPYQMRIYPLGLKPPTYTLYQ